MSYEYQSGLAAVSLLGQWVVGIAGIALAVGLIFSLGFYLVKAYSIYKIAQRRGISHAWLAWIPVAGTWILGSISDQYQYVSKGKVKNIRIILLVLSILGGVFAGFVLISHLRVLLGSIGLLAGGLVTEGSVAASIMTSGLLGMLHAAVSIAALIFYYIALYDLYRSCEPQNAVLYLVLSVLFGVTQPIFLLCCRNDDQGMPPRRDDL